MTTVPLGVSAYDRRYAKEPPVELFNRFFEKTPANLVEGSQLIARPGTTFFAGIGTGTIRKQFTQPGAFGGDLFIVSGTELWRYDGENAPYQILGAVGVSQTPAITAVAGPGYEHLFIADGSNLQFYDGLSAANGTLTVTTTTPPNIVNGDGIEIGGVYYDWTSGSVDTGTPAGTLADPWLVALGGDDAESLSNMFLAINAEGTAGTTYSTLLQAHTTVMAVEVTETTLDVRARTRGAAGNAITTTETGAELSWDAGTLEGGGVHALSGVPTPDGVAIVDVETLASHVLAVVANSQRFYWILPGEVIIDPLNFAEAESEPDELIKILRVGDQVWMLGESSAEPWYATGQTGTGSAFAPIVGRGLSQGIVEGTAVRVGNAFIAITEDGIVNLIGGQPQRISNHGIEDIIAIALKEERENG